MVKNLFVEPGHFLFWPCKCGHIFGRHGGELFSGKMDGCFECDCKRFMPAQSLESWREHKPTGIIGRWFIVEEV
jgi:hypothetical protein